MHVCMYIQTLNPKPEESCRKPSSTARAEQVPEHVPYSCERLFTTMLERKA